MKANIFEVKERLERFGFWYALWFDGVSIGSLWTLWCAHRMCVYEEKRWVDSVIVE